MFRFLSSFNIFGRWFSPKSWSFRQISDSLQGKFTTNIGTQIMWVKGRREPGFQKTFKGIIISSCTHTQKRNWIICSSPNDNPMIKCSVFIKNIQSMNIFEAVTPQQLRNVGRSGNQPNITLAKPPPKNQLPTHRGQCLLRWENLIRMTKKAC